MSTRCVQADEEVPVPLQHLPGVPAAGAGPAPLSQQNIIKSMTPVPRIFLDSTL